jgi:hypothetical protein
VKLPDILTRLLRDKLNFTKKTVLCTIEIAIPSTEIAIGYSLAQKLRKNGIARLPSQMVVYLIIALSLWSKDSMRDILKNLIDGLIEVWLKTGKYWKTPCKAAIT